MIQPLLFIARLSIIISLSEINLFFIPTNHTIIFLIQLFIPNLLFTGLFYIVIKTGKKSRNFAPPTETSSNLYRNKSCKTAGFLIVFTLGKIYLKYMIKIERKYIDNKPFYYLSEQVNIGKKFKKIQIYIGKNIPSDLSSFYSKLEKKEIDIILDNITNIFSIDKKIGLDIYKAIEKNRIKFKYYFTQLSKKKEELFWRDFAIKFIFESNAIEGSKLSESEIENIVKNKYVKKSLDRKEVREVENSIKAFEKIKGTDFSLNQNTIKDLHRIVVNGLDVEFGYKKKKIVVNNKDTCPPKKVRSEMTKLLNWWNKEKKTNINQFLLAIKFHQRFELIHPFSDGNGRVGRLILNWMLMQKGYEVILFRNKNRQKYFRALSSADEGRNNKLYRYCVDVYKKTYLNLIQ